MIEESAEKIAACKRHFISKRSIHTLNIMRTERSVSISLFENEDSMAARSEDGGWGMSSNWARRLSLVSNPACASPKFPVSTLLDGLLISESSSCRCSLVSPPEPELLSPRLSVKLGSLPEQPPSFLPSGPMTASICCVAFSPCFFTSWGTRFKRTIYSFKWTNRNQSKTSNCEGTCSKGENR